ncbi:neprilysin, putative, partial [Ixodes scapularis]
RNLADNGGVRCAFDAYVFAASQDRKIIQLKGLDSFEEDQLFFLNYCYKFCGVNRDVSPGKRGGGSSYPVERLRCNVPLMNLPEFSNAFDCEPGAAMNPSERCSAW